MASYIIQLPQALTKASAFETWQRRDIETRISAYNSTNPLGISKYMSWIVMVYFPFLVIVSGAANGFALYVFRSRFLNYLVIQPLLCALLYIQIILVFVGPLYTWLVQYTGIHLGRNQLYPCFLVVWVHNFATLATSGLLVTMVIERALSIGKPEVLWRFLQNACQKVIKMVVVASLALGMIGFMAVDGSVNTNRFSYPICLPWWSNEHIQVTSAWYKILASSFTLGPGVVIIFSLVLLLSKVARFKQTLRTSSGTLNHYNALYLQIKSTLHMRFVKSIFWIGMMFVFLSTPIGCFVTFGPAIYYSINPNEKSFLLVVYKLLQPSPANSVEFAKMDNKSVLTKETQLFENVEPAALDYSYIVISRSDTETMLWVFYYTFSLSIVPVFLVTEVLFRREWKYRLSKTFSGNRFCRKSKCSAESSSFELPQYNNADLIGPYIARSSVRHSLPINSNTTSHRVEEIKIYYAGKVEQAGRKVEEGNTNAASKTIID